MPMWAAPRKVQLIFYIGQFPLNIYTLSCGQYYISLGTTSSPQGSEFGSSI